MSAAVQVQWSVKIPMRDGVSLNATLYLPARAPGPAPTLFTLTPYIAQTYHDRGMYFAANGYPFLTVDVRGRGNSEGEYQFLSREGEDGLDIVRWIARQPYCDGKLAMWGGSYSGFNQWATARELPPELATIVPVASPYIGCDYPVRNNIFSCYLMQWLTLIMGRASQEKIFWDQAFWNRQFQRWFESGAPFNTLDRAVGNPSPIFQEWLAHPSHDDYWSRYNPTSEQYAKISIPVLTITGLYDSDQPGALMHYRKHRESLSPAERARHYLVIGPWDHAGTRTPKAEVAGLQFGPESLLDLPELHLQWYGWTLRGGRKPPLLERNVAYYVAGAEQWAHADSLEAITLEHQALHLSSMSPSDAPSSGQLTVEARSSPPDEYVHDPRDLSSAQQEGSAADPLSLRPTFPTENLTSHEWLGTEEGKQCVYYSLPFTRATVIAGFFRLRLWIAIDQPDTDFLVRIFEIEPNGSSIFLTSDWLRARYRESFREEKLIRTSEPQLYEFSRFTFMARRLTQGSRLALVVGSINSIHMQRNCNTGGVVSEESMTDARVVTVRLFHDAAHPSVLYVPLGHSVT